MKSGLYRIFQYLVFPFIVGSAMWVVVLLLGIFERNLFSFIPLIILPTTYRVVLVLERIMPFKSEWNVTKVTYKTDLVQSFITLATATKVVETILPTLLY